MKMDEKIQIVSPPQQLPSKVYEGMGEVHPSLPQMPFFVGVIGPRHSGKSVLLWNLLQKKKGMYGSVFHQDNIILYTPTKDKDPTLSSLKIHNMYGPPTDVEWLIDGIRKQQQDFSEVDDMTGVLMVFDDITQIRNAWKPLEMLSYVGRHDHIHVMYVSHKMSSIPRGIRTQTQQWIIFKPHEESEFQWVLDMFSKKSNREEWQAALEKAWSIPHNFIYINFEEKDKNLVYRSGFHDPLFTS
jgi:hypothetical protein